MHSKKNICIGLDWALAKANIFIYANLFFRVRACYDSAKPNLEAKGECDPGQCEFKAEASTTLWIGIGVGIFILIIVIISFCYCCYRTQIQKKPLLGTKKDVQQKVFLPDASKKANVVKEKPEDEKSVVAAKPEPTKESTKEETTVTKEKQPKPTKKKASKKKKGIVEPKPSKEITQENVTKEDDPGAKKFSNEPTLQDPSAEASVVQQKQLRNPPRV
uniref:Uncharacterized protein n=1 Tax=Panagrolaimus sp. PS1159 TaxID=55785 RepID=A0AC35EYY9_9BILA